MLAIRFFEQFPIKLLSNKSILTEFTLPEFTTRHVFYYEDKLSAV